MWKFKFPYIDANSKPYVTCVFVCTFKADNSEYKQTGELILSVRQASILAMDTFTRLTKLAFEKDNKILFTPFLIFSIIRLTSQSYEIQPIPDKAGIFYQDLGIAKISVDNFALLSFTNISIFHQQLLTCRNIYTKSETPCNQLRRNNTLMYNTHSSVFSCEQRIESLKFRISQLDEKFETICHLTGHKYKYKIQKRNLRRRFLCP